MVETRKPDFSGWATVSGLECSDGRTIMPDAFKHQDKTRVPLVWQHDHKNADNVLGHADLENRAFGVYARGYFNNSESGRHAKEMVSHGDITALSIYANRLKQRGPNVLHGNIVELSLVMSGANPGALIDDVSLSHSDTGEFDAVIYTGLELLHQDEPNEGTNMTEENGTQGSEKTVEDVFNELTEEQKNVVYYMVGEAVAAAENGESDDDSMAQSGITTEDILSHIDETIGKGLSEMSRNVFEDQNKTTSNAGVLSHSQFADIVAEARNTKADSFREVLLHSSQVSDVLAHAETNGTAGVDYGITDISTLFPDAKVLGTTPDFIARRMEWVNTVLTGTKHSPFAKVKTVHADITEPEARAKGYLKGTRKKEEVFKLLKRTTSPTTVYKKQKLDRDDILDITDFDVVVWLQAEIRLMLEEEVARAILVGDGRSSIDDDKIQDPEGAIQGVGIRSILHDDELYSHKVQLSANVSAKDMVKGIVRARTNYRGTGKPTLFISDNALTDIMLLEDKFERPLYETEQALADKLRVSNIVTVDLFDETENLLCILVNLADYTVGTNKGGEITTFDDFDLNFNQHIYLSETRLSGGLTKVKSAIVVTRALGQKATPTGPSFDGKDKITIPTVTGVEYYINQEVVTGVVTIVEDTEVVARPADGYFFESNITDSWTFNYTPGE